MVKDRPIQYRLVDSTHGAGVGSGAIALIESGDDGEPAEVKWLGSVEPDDRGVLRLVVDS